MLRRFLFSPKEMGSVTSTQSKFLKIFCIVFLGGFLVSLPFPSFADTLKTLHLEWNYDTSLSGLAGYRIYNNGINVYQVDDPQALAVDVDVLLLDGENSITMTAFDVNGNESAQSEPYLVDNQPTDQSGNQLPVAVIQADAVSGEAPLTVTFDGTGSSDPDGSITEYFWEMGDGASRADEFFSYTFTEGGNYTVRLTVTDDLGAVSSETVTISVSNPPPMENLAPTAVIDADNQSGVAPLNVVFDGSWSSDPDGSIVSYLWRFGDGTTGSGFQVSHLFTSEGDYLVSLTVTDDGGKTATTSQVIKVTAPPISNTAPTAVIKVDKQSGEAPLSIQFDGSDSVDKEGQVVNYMWDFGDGSTASGISVSHTYTMAGTYTAMLTVADELNVKNTASILVTVTTPANHNPEAVDDIAAGDENTEVVVDVLSNDIDVDGDSLSITDIDQPADGLAELTSGGIRYTPARNYHGKDGFSYSVSDGHGGTSVGHVDVWINKGNGPTANSGSGSGSSSSGNNGGGKGRKK